LSPAKARSAASPFRGGSIRSADEARIAAHFGSLKRRHRRARLVLVAPDTPYRCVGGVIFQAQRAGLSLGFAAAAPPARR
jgi:hypothetical protein